MNMQSGVAWWSVYRQLADAKKDIARLSGLTAFWKRTCFEVRGEEDEQIAQLKAENTRLTAIVEPLTKTLDGVTPAVGDVLWSIGISDAVVPMPPVQWIPSVSVARSYSTREAAEQARAAQEPLPDGGQAEGQKISMGEARKLAFRAEEQAEERRRKFTEDEAEKGER